MNDKELIQLSRQGNEKAFGALVQKYKIKVFHLAFSLIRNREIADDLSQEVFIKAYSALSQFKFKSEFGTWLYRITVNHVKDYLKKQSRIKMVSFSEVTEPLLIEGNEMEKKEKEEAMKQTKRLVHNAIQSLPEKYQIILSLRDIQGFSYNEIMEILKLSPGTVDSRLYRARRLLRKKIEPFFKIKGGGHEM